LLVKFCFGFEILPLLVLYIDSLEVDAEVD
jgi:hypothetical protein